MEKAEFCELKEAGINTMLFDLRVFLNMLKSLKRQRSYIMTPDGRSYTKAREISKNSKQGLNVTIVSEQVSVQGKHFFSKLKECFESGSDLIPYSAEQSYMDVLDPYFDGLEDSLNQMRENIDCADKGKQQMLKEYKAKLLMLLSCKEKVGCQFSGGSKHGFSLVGVTEEFQDQGLEFTDVTGVSAGSIFAAIYGSFYGLQNVDMGIVKEKMNFLLENEIFDFKTYNPFRKTALLDKVNLEQILKNFFVKERKEIKLSDIKGINLKILATVRESGDLAVFSNTSRKTRENSLWEVVLASCSVPVLYEPTEANRMVGVQENSNYYEKLVKTLLIDGSMIRDFFIEDMAKYTDFVINVYINPLSDLIHNWDVPFRDEVVNYVKEKAEEYNKLSEKEWMQFLLKKLRERKQNFINTGLLTAHHVISNLPQRDAGGSADVLVVPSKLGLLDMLFVSKNGVRNMIENGKKAVKEKKDDIWMNLPILKKILEMRFKDKRGIYEEIKTVKNELADGC